MGWCPAARTASTPEALHSVAVCVSVSLLRLFAFVRFSLHEAVLLGRCLPCAASRVAFMPRLCALLARSLRPGPVSLVVALLFLPFLLTSDLVRW